MVAVGIVESAMAAATAAALVIPAIHLDRHFRLGLRRLRESVISGPLIEHLSVGDIGITTQPQWSLIAITTTCSLVTTTGTEEVMVAVGKLRSLINDG